ncbi:MAG TPA: hypothetical protein VGE08_18065 [Steroidobacter sp.]|uniref:sugar phosphate isomerase/epimerase family protein n=1 Tax=Steroidobacter sp. TaxID=1978227 RepID=UPI002EDB276D
MRRLLVYQALWGMEHLPGVDLEGALDAALDRILAAGFDGVGVSLLNTQRASAVARAVHKRGKSFEAIGFARHTDDLAALIGWAEDLGAHHLNVQIMARLDRVTDAVKLLEQFEATAAHSKLPVHYETHRGRLTNDLLFLVRILRELPSLRLTGDLSHYVLAHEMPLPVPDADLERMRVVIDHCWAFHGRVASSHQIQVSLNAPQHQGWVQQFQQWWLEGFARWRSRSAEDAELTFMAELGPPHYAITTADGAELSDRWQEALQLKDWARSIWEQVETTDVLSGGGLEYELG